MVTIELVVFFIEDNITSVQTASMYSQIEPEVPLNCRGAARRIDFQYISIVSNPICYLEMRLSIWLEIFSREVSFPIERPSADNPSVLICTSTVQHLF